MKQNSYQQKIISVGPHTSIFGPYWISEILPSLVPHVASIVIKHERKILHNIVPRLSPFLRTEPTESTRPPLTHRCRRSRCSPLGAVHKVRRSGAERPQERPSGLQQLTENQPKNSLSLPLSLSLSLSLSLTD